MEYEETMTLKNKFGETVAHKQMLRLYKPNYFVSVYKISQWCKLNKYILIVI